MSIEGKSELGKEKSELGIKISWSCALKYEV